MLLQRLLTLYIPDVITKITDILMERLLIIKIKITEMLLMEISYATAKITQMWRMQCYTDDENLTCLEL